MEVINNTDGSTGVGYSSKGNQFKLNVSDKWYKADFLGYEGAAEYVASRILTHSNVPEYVVYELENISYNGKGFNGCVSENFLKPGQQIITAKRLFQAYYDKTVEEILEDLPLEQKISTFVSMIKNVTGLDDFGKYLTMLLEFDAYILNEDRHFHNIAVLQNAEQTFSYCPVFDNGGAFLSDIRNDYPLESSIYGLISDVHAKPFSEDFDKQVECCRKLYGAQFQVKPFDLQDEMEPVQQMYGTKIQQRIYEIQQHQEMMYPEFITEKVRQIKFCGKDLDNAPREHQKKSMNKKPERKGPRL